MVSAVSAELKIISPQVNRRSHNFIPLSSLVFIFAIILSGCALNGFSQGSGDIGLSAQERVQLGAIYERKGLNDLALREYEAASEMGLAFGVFAAANILYKEQKYDEAINGYLEAIEKDPDNPAYYNNLAWAYMEKGAFEKALVEAEQALKRATQDRHMYLDTAAVALLRLGDIDGAERYLDEALSVAPVENIAGLAEIYRHRIELYSIKGDDLKVSRAQEKLKALNNK